MKRLLCLFLGIVMLLPTLMLSGCKDKTSDEGEGEQTPTEETVTERIERMYAEGIGTKEELEELRALIWQEYVEKVKTEEPGREKELVKNKVTKIKIGRITMRVDTRVVGRKAPEGGYPLFLVYHGGGYDPSGSTNDSQWSGMADRYIQTGVPGIYVSIRSVSDNESSGQIFSTDISWQFYDRIIENAVIFMNANANKVYAVGYSAGGNGVYQIAPTMADSLASATMTAGHPEGVDLTNLYNLPFYLNVGELDKAYNRNTETVVYANKLEALAKSAGGGYEHYCFVHTNKEHGVVGDNATSPQSVIKDIDAWYDAQINGKAYTGGSESAVTDAATLMTQHTRNPLPERIIWDIGSSRMSARKNDTFYWLSAKGIAGKIVASVDKSTNTVTIEQANKKGIDEVTVYLNEDMVDLFSEVKVVYNGKTTVVNPQISLDLLRQTTQDRRDPNYQFCVSVTVKI